MTATMPKHDTNDYIHHNGRPAQIAMRFSLPEGPEWRYLIRYTDGRHQSDPQSHHVKVVDEREIISGS